MKVDPYQSRNAEDIDKVDRDENAQQTECNRLAPAQNPVEKRNEQQAKPSGPDVRNEHGAIVVARLREIVEVAFGATLVHIEGSHECPTARLEHFAFVAAWAFEMKNAVPLCSF